MKGIPGGKLKRSASVADQYRAVEALGQLRKWPESLPILREIIEEDDREIQAYTWLRGCSRKTGVSAVEEAERFISAKIEVVERRANANMACRNYNAAIYDYTVASYLLPRTRHLPLTSLKIVACWLANQQKGSVREKECDSLGDCAYEKSPETLTEKVCQAIASFSSGVLLVHSMLSSGSTHVADLLRATMDDALIVMTPHAIGPLYVAKPFLSGQSLLASFVREHFFDKLRIITMVRAPLDFLFSAYFFKRSPNTKDAAATNHFISDFINIFIPSYLGRGCWFDENMRSLFGIDVFADPYIESPGGRAYRNRKLLVLRIEDMNRLGAEVCLPPFIGVSTLNEVTNRRANTNNPDYLRLKNTIKVPGEIAKEICGMAYFREFYSPDEIDMHIQKWT